MKTLFLILFISYSLTGLTQYNSNLGRFEVSEVTGCAPFTVNVNNLQACTCDVNYGDGSTVLQNNYTHTYTVPGTYFLEIDYASQLPRTDVIEITVLPNNPPTFDVLTCAGSQVQVDITDTFYDEYMVDFGDDGTIEATVTQGFNVPVHTFPGPGTYDISVRGRLNNAEDNCNPSIQSVTTVNAVPATVFNGIQLLDAQSFTVDYTPQPNIELRLEISSGGTNNFQFLEPLDNSGNETFSNSALDFENTVYCFRVGSFDVCNNTSAYSNTLCSVDMSLSINDGVNQLNWSSIPGANSFTVCRDGDCNYGSTASNQFNDTVIDCNTQYCYAVIANFTSGGSTHSLEYCGVSFSTTPPPTVSNIITQINDNSVAVSWPVDPNFTPTSTDLIISNGTTNRTETGLTTNTYTDIASEKPADACYQVIYTDNCGNTSGLSNAVCTLNLSATVSRDNVVNLRWNTYSGYTNGIQEYRIERLNENGATVATFSTNGTSYADNTDITQDQVVYYKVYAVPNDLLDPSYSATIRVIKRSIISKPQAFTPNGDGLNDTFSFSGTFIEAFELQIFNRWGELLYVTSDMATGWNGFYKGKLLPSGSYPYSAKITDRAGRSWELTGFVALIRN